MPKGHSSEFRPRTSTSSSSPMSPVFQCPKDILLNSDLEFPVVFVTGMEQRVFQCPKDILLNSDPQKEQEMTAKSICAFQCPKDILLNSDRVLHPGGASHRNYSVSMPKGHSSEFRLGCQGGDIRVADRLLFQCPKDILLNSDPVHRPRTARHRGLGFQCPKDILLNSDPPLAWAVSQRHDDRTSFNAQRTFF